MKTQNMYLNRLLKLARHLGKNYLNDSFFHKQKNYSSKKAGCNIEHFYWALLELPKIAPEQWKINEAGDPYLISHRQLNSITAAGFYFNLTGDELFHLFVPGYQEQLFRGKALGENANPIDFTNNIYEFVELKEHQNNMKKFDELLLLCANKKREKKITKKYKYKTAA